MFWKSGDKTGGEMRKKGKMKNTRGIFKQKGNFENIRGLLFKTKGEFWLKQKRNFGDFSKTKEEFW